MDEIQELPIAAYGNGPVGIKVLKDSLPSAWELAISDPAMRQEIADILHIEPGSLNQLPPPFKLDRGPDEGIADVAVAVVVTWIGNEIFAEVFKDILRDEVRRRVGQVWDLVKDKLSAVLEKRDALGKRANDDSEIT